MNESRLSLLDIPYNEQNKTEPVYTSAFNKPKKERWVYCESSWQYLWCYSKSRKKISNEK